MDFDLGRAQNGAHSRRTRVYPPRLADMGRRILPAPPTPYPRSRDHPERVVQRPLRDTGISPTRMRMRDDRRGVESQILTPAKRTPRFDREKFFGGTIFFRLLFFWRPTIPIETRRAHEYEYPGLPHVSQLGLLAMRQCRDEEAATAESILTLAQLGQLVHHTAHLQSPAGGV